MDAGFFFSRGVNEHRLTNMIICALLCMPRKFCSTFNILSLIIDSIVKV